MSLGGVSSRVWDNSCVFLGGLGVVPHLPHPLEMGKIWPFLGRLNVFQPVSCRVQAPAIKKPQLFLAKKRRRIQQKKRRTDRTPLRRRINLTDQTYGTEEVSHYGVARCRRLKALPLVDEQHPISALRLERCINALHIMHRCLT